MVPQNLGEPLGLALLEIEKKKAKERQRQHGFTAPGRPKTLCEDFRRVFRRASDFAASKVGLSGKTLRKAAFVVEKKKEGWTQAQSKPSKNPSKKGGVFEKEEASGSKVEVLTLPLEGRAK